MAQHDNADEDDTDSIGMLQTQIRQTSAKGHLFLCELAAWGNLYARAWIEHRTKGLLSFMQREKKKKKKKKRGEMSIDSRGPGHVA